MLNEQAIRAVATLDSAEELYRVHSFPEEEEAQACLSSTSAVAVGDIDAPPLDVKELLTLINIDCNNNTFGKKRGHRDPSPSRHVRRDKERRDELSQAISEIGELVPASDANAAAKRTKLAILRDAAEYFTRVQQVTLLLMQENRRLTASLQTYPSLSRRLSPSPSSDERSLLQPEDAVRLLFLSTLIIWFFDVPLLPWHVGFVTSSATFFSSRSLLNTETSISSRSALFKFLCSVLAFSVSTLATICAALLVLWLCTLLRDMPRVSMEQLCSAKAHLKEAEAADEMHNNRRLGKSKRMEAMAALSKSLPISRVGEVSFFLAQVMRAALHRMRVGLWLERLVVYMLGRQEAHLLEGKAYMLECSFTAGSDARYFACALAASSSLNAVAAPDCLKEELSARVRIFLTDLATSSRFKRFLRSLLLGLVDAQLNLTTTLDEQGTCEVSDWKFFRILSLQAPHDSLEKALDSVTQLAMSLKGGTQYTALASAGLVCFCLRRYRDAFLLLSSALRFNTSRQVFPLIATRIWTSATIICLSKLDFKEEASSLLLHLERLYVGIPEGRTNLLPLERLYIISAKVALAGTDYEAVLAHSRELLSLTDVTGLERLFDAFFLLELLLERQLSALQLANTAAAAPARPTSKNEAFVAHHRGDIHELVNASISLLARCTYQRGALVFPPLERMRGWYALMSTDDGGVAASFHFHRGLSEARRLGQDSQVSITLELMERLGIADIRK